MTSFNSVVALETLALQTSVVAEEALESVGRAEADYEAGRLCDDGYLEALRDHANALSAALSWIGWNAECTRFSAAPEQGQLRIEAVRKSWWDLIAQFTESQPLPQGDAARLKLQSLLAHLDAQMRPWFGKVFLGEAIQVACNVLGVQQVDAARRLSNIAPSNTLLRAADVAYGMGVEANISVRYVLAVECERKSLEATGFDTFFVASKRQLFGDCTLISQWIKGCLVDEYERDSFLRLLRLA